MEANDFVSEEHLDDMCVCGHNRSQHTKNQHCRSANCNCEKFDQKNDDIDGADGK
jgi:hypothetical protein